MTKIAAGHWLSVILSQHWLWIEAVDVRQSTIHKQKDDMLRLRLEMRVLDHPRTARHADFGLCKRFTDHAGKAHHRKSAANSTKCIAAVNWFWLLAKHELAS